MLSWIPDEHYLESGYVAPAKGLYDELRFTYRPLLVTERAKVANQASLLKDGAYEKWIASVLARKLRSWTLSAADGSSVSVSEENLLRLKPDLFLRVTSIVCGFSPSDTDPEEEPTDSHGSASAIGSDDPLAEREELDRKN